MPRKEPKVNVRAAERTHRSNQRRDRTWKFIMSIDSGMADLIIQIALLLYALTVTDAYTMELTAKPTMKH